MITDLYIVLYEEGEDQTDRQRTFDSERDALDFVGSFLVGRRDGMGMVAEDKLRKIMLLDTRRDKVIILEPVLDNMKIKLKPKGDK